MEIGSGGVKNPFPRTLIGIWCHLDSLGVYLWITLMSLIILFTVNTERAFVLDKGDNKVSLYPDYPYIQYNSQLFGGKRGV